MPSAHSTPVQAAIFLSSVYNGIFNLLVLRGAREGS